MSANKKCMAKQEIKEWKEKVTKKARKGKMFPISNTINE